MASLAQRFPPQRSGWRRVSAPRGGGRVLRVLAGLCAAVIGLGAVGGAGLYLRLSQGPLPLDAVARWAERAVLREAPGLALEIGGLSLSLEDDLALRLSDVVLRDDSGETLARAPQALLELHGASLLRGALRPVRLRVAGPSTLLRRDAQGRFSLAIGAAGPDDPAAPSEREAVAAVLAALEGAAPVPLQRLREIAVEDAAVIYEDAVSGRIWRGERGALRVSRDAAGELSARASLSLPGKAGRPPTRLRARGRRLAGGGATLRLAFADAEPAALADQFPAFDALRAVDAPLRGDLSVSLDGAGALLGFDGVLRAGAGRVRAATFLDAAPQTLDLESALLDVAFDPEAGRYALRRAEIEGASGRIALSGFVDLERDGEGVAHAAAAQFEIEALGVAHAALFEEPVAFDGGRLVARLDLEARALEVAQFHLSRGALRLDAEGRAALGAQDGWEAAVTLRGRDLDASALKRLWPVPAAPGARRWVRENLAAGAVDQFELAADLSPQAQALTLSFAFRDAAAHYLRPLPPIEDAAGWGVVTLDEFGLALERGRVRAPSGGEIALSGARMRLPDLDDPQALSVIELDGAGPIAAILEVLDQPPLALPSKLDLDPLGVGGAARAQAWLTLPLLEDLRLEQVGVDAEAALTDVSLRVPGVERVLRAPRATLTANTARLSAQGAGALGDVPLRFDWTETFSPEPGAPASRFRVETEVTRARAAEFGAEIAPWFGGSAPAIVEIGLLEGGEARFDARLDLTRAALRLDALGWDKAAGAPAALRAQGAQTRQRIALERVALTAPGLEAQGSARLGADGAFEALDLSRVRFGARTDIAVSAAAGASGLRARVSGARLDLADFRGLGRSDVAAREGQAGGEDAAIDVEIAVERLDLIGDLSVRAARGTLSQTRGGAVLARLDGRVRGAQAESAPASLRFEGSRTGGVARLEAPDGGALLRGAGLFADAVGGALEATARVSLAPALSVEGSARLRGATIIEDPTLRRLLAEARLEEAERRLTREGGLAFDEIRTDFAFDGATLRLDDLVAAGPAIGVTLSGEYDIYADALDMQGVFTPLYALNSALGAIPLLGDLLTGGEGEGVIGFNFALSGPSDDPRVGVNPLSGLAPGVLRRLFAEEGPPDAEAEATRARREENR